MTASAAELDDATHAEIIQLCAVGDEFVKQRQYESAVIEYNKAWKLVPDPKNNWETSTWILAAIADACFFLGKLKSSRQALEYAMTCPGGLGNPFLHLRLGQVLYDLDDPDAAVNELMRAYMGAGEEIFGREEPKYLAFLRTKAKL